MGSIPDLGRSHKPQTLCVQECQIASAMSDSFRPYELVAHQVPLSMGFSRQEH